MKLLEKLSDSERKTLQNGVIEVHGKTMNRTALGVVDAMLQLYPNATFEELKIMLPDSINPAAPKNYKSLFRPYTDKMYGVIQSGSIRKECEENENNTIALPTGSGGFVVLKLDDITFCEADGAYTTFHTVENRRYLTSYNLAKFDNLFSESSFYRIHRSTLLNLIHVKELQNDGTIMLSNGKSVNVSSRNKTGFIKMMKMMNFSLD